MVYCSPGARAQSDVAFSLSLSGRLEQGGVHYPHERPFVFVDQAAALTDLQAGCTQQGAGRIYATSGEEDTVAGLGASSLSQTGTLGVGNVLSNRTTQGAVLTNSYVGQALSAALLGPFLPSIESTARLAGATGHNHGAHIGGLKYAEGGVLEELG